LFEVIKTMKQTITNNLTKLFNQYGSRNKIIVYVKNKGSNLNTMSIVLKFVVKCEVLGLDEVFKVRLFWPFFSNACQHAIIDKKICKNLKFVSIKSA